MKKIVVFIVILLGVNVSLLAQNDARGMFNPVLTGVTSLSIAPDSRAGAMGDVGVATDPDVNSQYWNPAKYLAGLYPLAAPYCE